MTSNTTEPGFPQTMRSVEISANEIQSEALFRFGREVLIRHDGEVYRLRLTSRNKLILTK